MTPSESLRSRWNKPTPATNKLAKASAPKRTYVTHEELAVEVWYQLELSEGAGCTTAELIERTGYSYAQVRAGLGEIQHQLQGEKKQPIAMSSGWRWILPEHRLGEGGVMPWTRNRMKDALTRLRTETKRAEATKLRWANSSAARRTYKLMVRLVEDMEELLEVTV